MCLVGCCCFLTPPHVKYLHINDVRVIIVVRPAGNTISFNTFPFLLPRSATVDYELIRGPRGVTMAGGRIIIPTNIPLGEYNITVKATGKGGYSGETVATFKLNAVPQPPANASCFSFSGGEITGYTCSNRNVVIPASINGVAVRSIGNNAFASKQLRSVTIPNSVTSIGRFAFANTDISSVTISNSVTSIGNHAFQHNRLTSVTIPHSVTHIGDYAFQHNRLRSIYIPNSVVRIGPYAFAYNTNLTSVNMKSGIAYDSTSFGLCTRGNRCITIRW